MRDRDFFFIALIVLLFAVLVGQNASRVNQGVVDVSWPNCKVRPAAYQAGIVGVTGGLDFHQNPCLAQESTWFVYYAAYVNTGYPGNARARKYMSSPRHCSPYDSQCLAYNYGFHEAQYAIQYADLQNVHTNLWWLDVETENSWTEHLLVNRQFINGVTAGIKQNIWFATVGVYSSPIQWEQIVGAWHNKLPAWIATGGTSRPAAVRDCRDQAFTGGSLWLTQYTAGLDHDPVCAAQLNDQLLGQPGAGLFN